jgi:hypothetical protein
MRKTILVSLITLIFGIGCIAYAQSKAENDPVGTWSGTWTGGSTGKFEMNITKGANGKLSATLTATPDQGEGFTGPFKSVEATGNKLVMKFEAPDGESEATLEAVIEGSSLKGNYAIRAKASGEEVEKGTFTASRK